MALLRLLLRSVEGREEGRVKTSRLKVCPSLTMLLSLLGQSVERRLRSRVLFYSSLRPPRPPYDLAPPSRRLADLLRP
jgi:hypothetical protein